MKIWLINHYATPIKYHLLARTTNFAKYLMQMGNTVTIFEASSVHNSEINLITDKTLYREEIEDGVHYVYVRCRSYKGNGKDRIINMFEFPFRLKQVYKNFEKPDAILASSATPPACMMGLKIGKKLGVKAVAEISDLWPESFVEYGLIGRKNPLLALMYAYEKNMYIKADEIIFTMEGGYAYIRERGWENKIPLSKVHYINNGVDLDLFNYNKEHYQLRDEDLENNHIFKVVYTGSIRKVNNLGLLLNVAKEIRNNKVRFLVWGDGDERLALEQRLKEENISNVIFKGRVDKKYIPYIVSKADINFAHNTPSPLFRFGISFNKIFDYMAAGKPILSDFPCAYNPAVQFNAGVDVVDANSENIAREIEKFVDINETEFEKYCINAKKAALAYDFKTLTQKLEDILS